MGYVWCDGYVWDMCGVRYVWDMCGVRYANNLLKNPATKRLSGKKEYMFNDSILASQKAKWSILLMHSQKQNWNRSSNVSHILSPINLVIYVN